MTATNVKLIKEDPPAPSIGRNPGEVACWLQAVREEGSGDWFKFPKPISASTAWRIKTGKLPDTVSGEFEAVTRKVRKNRGTLYVKLLKR